MNGKAHTALGVGTAIGACEFLGLIGSSRDLNSVAVCVAVAATAATLPDIDVGAAHKVYRYSIYGMLGILVSIVAWVMLRHGRIGSIPLNVIGMMMVCGLSIYGKHQSHRGFTHSFLAEALFVIGIVMGTIGVPTQYRDVIVVSFAFAYMSHLLIDLLNKKGEQLLFPLPNRYCLKLCTASGLGNELTGLCGSFLTILFLGKLFI